MSDQRTSGVGGFKNVLLVAIGIAIGVAVDTVAIKPRHQVAQVPTRNDTQWAPKVRPLDQPWVRTPDLSNFSNNEILSYVMDTYQWASVNSSLNGIYTIFSADGGNTWYVVDASSNETCIVGPLATLHPEDDPGFLASALHERTPVSHSQ